MFRAHVQDGTGAGRKSRPDPRVRHCDCGGFISREREARGAIHCGNCQPCPECERSPESLQHYCEHCPRLTSEQREEWRVLQGYAATA